MPLCATTAAVVWYTSRKNLQAVALLLTLVCLCRETGFFLLAEFVAAELLRRSITRALLYGTSVMPALLWYVYVHTRPEATAQALGTYVPDWLGSLSHIGPAQYILHPVSYSFLPAITLLTQSLDRVATPGMLSAFALGVWYWRTAPKLALPLTGLFIAVSSLVTFGPPMWETIYNIARPYSPLLLLLALHGFVAPVLRWLWLRSIVTIDARILLQLAPQLLVVLGVNFTYSQ